MMVAVAAGPLSAQTATPTPQQSTAATAPRSLQTISYQGMIASDSGAVNGARTVTFKIYDSEQGGKLLWSEQQDVQIDNGIFRTTLGSIHPLSFMKEDGHYWYTITLDGQEMARTELLNGTSRLRAVNPNDTAGPSGPRYAPAQISYQGMISEGDKPIDGTRDLTFSIYDSEQGGKLLWKETQTLTLSKGIFSTKLGKITPLDTLLADGEYWFSLTLDGAEMSRMSLVMPNSSKSRPTPTAGTSQKATMSQPAGRSK
jgi:hypothetical protein